MEIFRSIDFKNRGVITSADFRRLCLDLDIGLTAGQIVWVFDQLDTDQDGLINSDDFIRGHRAFTDLFIDGVKSETVPGDVTPMTSDADGLARWKRFLETHDVELGILPSVRYTCTCDLGSISAFGKPVIFVHFRRQGTNVKCSSINLH